MSLKKTAEDLLKLADDIEKEAASVTEFVCNKCKHTATLATINASRTENAKEAGANVVVSDVTINDKITCPACDGVMAYNPTEASAPYYFDEKEAKKPTPEEIAEEEKETPEEQAREEQGEKLHKEPHEASAPIDYDKLDRYLRG